MAHWWLDWSTDGSNVRASPFDTCFWPTIPPTPNQSKNLVTSVCLTLEGHASHKCDRNKPHSIRLIDLFCIDRRLEFQVPTKVSMALSRSQVHVQNSQFGWPLHIARTADYTCPQIANWNFYVNSINSLSIS